jgi:AcrR family transcriptional regulator
MMRNVRASAATSPLVLPLVQASRLSSPAPARRRSQDERRTATRVAIVEAALATFQDLGYARTSTPEIARRAGVSQGSLFKHFRSKSDLVAAAVAQLFAELFSRFDAAFTTALRPRRSLVVAIRPLWKVYCHPRIRAAYMLYAEAPSDPELLAVLQPLVVAHASNIACFAKARFPELANPAVASTMITMVALSMQGAALQRCVAFNEIEEEAWLTGLEDLVARALPAPGANRALPAIGANAGQATKVRQASKVQARTQLGGNKR